MFLHILRRLSILAAVVLTPVSGPLAYWLGDDGLPTAFSAESVEDAEEEDGDGEETMVMVVTPAIAPATLESASLNRAASVDVPLVRRQDRQRGPPRV